MRGEGEGQCTVMCLHGDVEVGGASHDLTRRVGDARAARAAAARIAAAHAAHAARTTHAAHTVHTAHAARTTGVAQASEGVDTSKHFGG